MFSLIDCQSHPLRSPPSWDHSEFITSLLDNSSAIMLQLTNAWEGTSLLEALRAAQPYQARLSVLNLSSIPSIVMDENLKTSFRMKNSENFASLGNAQSMWRNWNDYGPADDWRARDPCTTVIGQVSTSDCFPPFT